jgi:hypothetical protein
MDEDPNPEALLAYFKRSQQVCPEDREWSEGARLTADWIASLRKGPPSQAEFDAFILQIETIPDRLPGSGWFDLWLRVRHWGYQAGLSVPEDHPWRVPPNHFLCRNPELFTEQLTQGKTYQAITRNLDKALLRLVDDRGKTRWYPASCFEEILPPERKYVRRNTT